MRKSASIVCIGNWNTKIFTPQWVMSKLFAVPEGESMNMNVNKDNLNLSFIWKEYSFSPTDKVVEIKTSTMDSNILKQAEDLFAKLVDYLPHTPIEAYGYNIKFDFDNSEFAVTKLKDLYNIKVVDRYNICTISLQAIEEQNYTKTILVEFKGGNIVVTFNLEFKNLLFAKRDEYCKYDILNEEIKKVLGDEYRIN